MPRLSGARRAGQVELGPDAARRGQVTALWDGFIYNAADLGAHAGQSDAELVAELVERHGVLGALGQVNGDFACAIYDERTRALWLARDRFGVRPLYYVDKPGLFAFAARPRPLLAMPGVRAEPRREFLALFAASHYRVFDNDPTRSPYEDVFQVPAACALEVPLEGKSRLHRYWTLEALPDLTEPEEALAERYRALLLDAVVIRLRRAERPAFTLSGGMDSSSVLACAVRQSGAKQPAISTIYEDKTYDESREIRDMLDETVSSWHKVSIGTPDAAALVERMVAAHDEPVATATWLSHFLLCERAKALGFGSLFGGLGGDELNAGEYEYFFFHFADLAAAKRDRDLERETKKWIEYHDHPVFKKSFAAMQEGLVRLCDLKHPGRCRTDRKRLERYAAALAPGFFDLRSYEPVLDEVFPNYLKNRTYHDLFRETLPCCLRAQDRHGALFGLDHFLPFLDHRLVELMFRVPGDLKIRDGVTKHLLRRAMKGVLPEATRGRIKKTGWNAPAHVWFSGSGGELLRDLIASASFRGRGIYDAAEVQRLLKEHEEIVASARAQDNHMMFFWQLLNLELWLRSLEQPVSSLPMAENT